MNSNNSNTEILVIEDNEGDFIIIEELLNEEFQTPKVIRATNYVNAKKYLESKNNFKIILLDLTLPDAKGETLVNNIVKLSNNTAVIVLTGFSDKEFGIKTLSLGVSDYLLKDELTATQLYKAISYSIERKKNNLQLKLSEENYRSLFQLSPLPMWVYDIDTLHFLKVNEAAIIHYGYSESEFIFLSINDLIYQEDLTKTLHVLNLEKDNTKKIDLTGIRHKKKSGEVISVEMQFNTIVFNNRNAMLVLANDITDRIIAEENLKNSKEELRRLNVELEDRVVQRTAELADAYRNLESFSYSVSHDLQTPLRNIRNFTTLLQKSTAEIIDEKSREYLSVILNNAVNMQALINDMLDFSRLSKSQLNRELFSFQDLVQLTWRELTIANNANVKLICNDLPNIIADKKMIKQVLINLLGNAVKYSSKKDVAVVEAGVFTKDNEHTFYIKDNGCGFDMKYYNRLFDLFQRLHSSSEFEGTGIGLSIVKLIIEKHNGHVWAESKVGEGATFYFTLQAEGAK